MVTKQWKMNNSKRYWATQVMAAHRQSGYSLDFTVSELFDKIKDVTHCPLCHVKLRFPDGTGVRHPLKNSASLDRMFNEKHLTLDTVWVICHQCNRTKGDRTLPEFIEYCKTISSF